MFLRWMGKYKKSTLHHLQKTYNDIHGHYRARMEHLFAPLVLESCV